MALTTVLCATMTPPVYAANMNCASLATTDAASLAATAADTVTSPIIGAEGTEHAGETLAYSKLTIGSYPQSELVLSESAEEAAIQSLAEKYNTPYQSFPEEEWNKITSATYDSNGDAEVSVVTYTSAQNVTPLVATVSAIKVHRMLQKDATNTTAGLNGYYSWADSTEYHYYLYEPITWRVLSKDGETALLLSDKILDDRRYNNTYDSVTWAKSDIRKWLNLDNANSFLNLAFSEKEKASILPQTITTSENPTYQISGGEASLDKLFLLSYDEVCHTSTAAAFGFANGDAVRDTCRGAEPTTFAFAKGAFRSTETDSKGNSYWFLRTPGRYQYYTSYVKYDGSVSGYGDQVNCSNIGIRPAMVIDLSQDAWEYIGRFSPDGDEIAPETDSEDITRTYKITYVLNGGANSSLNKTSYVSGEDLAFEEPSRENYEFLGWYDNAAFAGTAITGITAATGDIVLYAAWKRLPPTHTITYVLSGGVNNPKNADNFREGDTVPLYEPTRDGYEFISWYRDAVRMREPVTMLSGDTSDVTVYAKWKKIRTMSVSAPRIESGTALDAGRTVTYDCVWFGSYPQSELVLEGSNTQSVLDAMKDEYSCEYEDVDAADWKKITEAEYDKNGEANVKLSDVYIRVRRISMSDATSAVTDTRLGRKDMYRWSDSDYHYFVYEPIKWRVLSVDSSNNALLLADRAIDDRKYNATRVSTTWEKSSLRSWLNNNTSKGFYGNAFDLDEKSAILETEKINANNLACDTEGGEDTKDKIFLLSEMEVYDSPLAETYGFALDALCNDEAKRCVPSTYAFAMGTYRHYTNKQYAGNCWWWLRSPGMYSTMAAGVGTYGEVTTAGTSVDYTSAAVRPTLVIDLDTFEWEDAGTVVTDGNSTETAPEEDYGEPYDPTADDPEVKPDDPEPEKNPCIILPYHEITIGTVPSKGKVKGNNSYLLVPEIQNMDATSKVAWTVRDEAGDTKAAKKYLSVSAGKLTSKKDSGGKTFIVRAAIAQGTGAGEYDECVVHISDGNVELPENIMTTDIDYIEMNIRAKGMKPGKPDANKGIMMPLRLANSDVKSKVVWTVSDPSILKISANGKAVPKRDGVTLVTATLGDKVVNYTVKVNEAYIKVDDAARKVEAVSGGASINLLDRVRSVAGTDTNPEHISWSVQGTTANRKLLLSEDGVIKPVAKGRVTVNAQINGVMTQFNVDIK